MREGRERRGERGERRERQEGTHTHTHTHAHRNWREVLLFGRAQYLTYCNTVISMQAASACEVFDVEQQEIGEGLYTAQLILKQPLNYETKRQYVLTLLAQVCWT